ncbi:organic cation transporter protein-like [Penaeus chinensis]|uniref:organic cation transporter protein-like n=1 Tax=Penaeus chinensis TaxID=139456 RepID=UPI001FB5C308|nr:organic cation transporter protein-like [Penaeus chinensis]
MNQLDDLLTQLGTGRWNILHILLFSYWFSLLSYHTLGGVFLAPKIDFTCRPPAASPHARTTNDSCAYFEEDSSTGFEEERPCTEWDFDNSTFSSTVTSEFGLVCEREYLRATYQSIYMLGIFVGAPLNGMMADRFGRLPMVAVSSIIYTVIAIGSSFLYSLPFLLGARFLLGLMHPTSLQTGYILVLEMAEPKWRSALGVSLFLSWAMGTMAWGGFAYLVRDWRWLQLTVSLPCLLFLPALFFLDESPRWLAVEGRQEKALRILKKAAKMNRVEIQSDEKILSILKDDQKEVQEKATHGNYKDKVKEYFEVAVILFRTPRLRIITIVMYFDYLVTGLVYFGLSLSGGNFSTNPFLYMALMGLMEVPGNTFVIPIITRFARKTLNIFFFVISGAALLALPFIPADHAWAAVTLAMVGKMSITFTFNILFLVASEVFPTEVRSRGMGTSLMMSRVGAMVAPFVTETLSSVCPWAPSVVFGASAVAAGLATLALPETKGVALPNTISRFEARSNTKDVIEDPRVPAGGTEGGSEEKQLTSSAV